MRATTLHNIIIPFGDFLITASPVSLVGLDTT